MLNIWKYHTKQITINDKIFSRDELIDFDISQLESWEKQNFDFIKEWLNEKDYIVVKTSGSTGKPKSIKLQKYTLVQSAINTGKALELSSADTGLLCLPSKYIAGKMMIVRAFVLDLNLISVEPKAVPLIDRTINFCALTPMQVHSIANNNINSFDKIDKLIIGGSKVTKELNQVLQNIPTKAYETYGMTETASHIALRKLNGKDKSDYFESFSNVQIGLDNRNCLTIESKDLKIEKLNTNDLVSIVDKNHFKWLGRYDNIINSGGIKLIPEEIEEKISSIIDSDFFVFSLQDEVLGNILSIVVEGNKSDDAIPFSSVLDKYQIPKRVFYLAQFLRTQTGKIDRKGTLAQISGYRV